MIVKNPWVGYLNRSYAAIKASVLARLKIAAPEVTDYSESNILIVIIGIFAGIGELLNYYIDSMAREGFLETAKKLISVHKIVRLINYRIRSSISSTVDLTFTSLGTDNLPQVVALGETITIPRDTQVTDSQGKSFLTTRVGYITEGLSAVSIPARQQSIVSLYSLATASGSADLAYNLPKEYDDRTLYVEVGGESWTLVENFGFSSPSAKHVTVEVDYTGQPYLLFGDGVNGAIPTAGALIRISFRTTLGLKGNLSARTLTTLVSNITIPSQNPIITKIDVVNINSSVGGVDVEGIERIRKSAPLSLRTLNRAVTRQDYIDVAKLAPSVDKADVKFSCGKQVTIYVSPIGGGIASNQMLADTQTFVEDRGIIGLPVEAKAAGETFIGAKINATAKFRINTNLAKKDIQNILVDGFSSEKSDINKPIRTSDIISLIDNLEKVDFLELVTIFAIPYARPVGHNRELIWERSLGEGCTQVLSWKIVWNGSNFVLYKGDAQIQTLLTNTSYTYLNILTVKILGIPAGIQSGDRWEFKTYPINKDILLDDYTMPRVSPDLSYITLTVKEQSFNGIL
jgi:hypothetical protein